MADTTSDLSTEVQAALNDGCSLAGGLAIETQVVDGQTVKVRYAQAVFLQKTATPPKIAVTKAG